MTAWPEPVCDNCGKQWPIGMLDGKPKRLRGGTSKDQRHQLSIAADHGEQFDWLEGDGWQALESEIDAEEPHHDRMA